MPLAARFHAPGSKLVVEEVAMPKVGENDVLIKVRAAGVCHTDIQLMENGLLLVPPVTMGHEIAGVVEATGPSVADKKKGDRVIVHSWTTCGKCYYCKHGREILCENNSTLPWYGFNVDGGYSDYVRVASRQVLPLSPEVPFDFAATMGCAGLTAYYGVNKAAKVRTGENVVIYGIGGLALYAIQFAKLAGADVTAIGRHEAKLSKAQELGADHVINATKENVAGAIKVATKGKGADAIIVFVPMMDNAVFKNSIDGLAKGGRIILAALSQPLNIDAAPFLFKEMSVSGFLGGSRKDLSDAVDIAGMHRIKSAVVETTSLEHVNEAFESMRSGSIAGRCVVTF